MKEMLNGHVSLCALGDQVGGGVLERTQAQRRRLAAAVVAIAEGTNVAQGVEVGDDVAAAEVMQWSKSELLRIRLSCFLPFAALLLHQNHTLLPPSPPAGQLTGRHRPASRSQQSNLKLMWGVYGVHVSEGSSKILQI